MSSGPLSRLMQAFGIGDKDPLDAGLERINNRLGFRSVYTEGRPGKVASIQVQRTSDRARSIFFAPDMDGHADSGEVVWVWAPTDGDSSTPIERAMLIVGRTHSTVLGLLISPNPSHADEDYWLEIGSGEWDEAGRQCWIRLDRILEVSEQQIRRKGILFPQRRFERVANRLRTAYHWV